MERHLVGCSDCRRELAELAALPALLARTPPPPVDPAGAVGSADPAYSEHSVGLADAVGGPGVRTDHDLAVMATALVIQRRARRRRSVMVGVAAAAVVCVAGLGAEVVAGGGPSNPPEHQVQDVARVLPLYEVGPPANGSSTAGTGIGSTRQFGTVTLQARQWGTAIVVQVTHLPPGGGAFVAWVSGGGYSRQMAGSWGPTTSHRATVTLATDVHADAISAVTVATGSGKVLLRS